MVKEYYEAKCKHCKNELYFSIDSDIKKFHKKVVCKKCGNENTILIDKEAKLIRDPKKIKEISKEETDLLETKKIEEMGEGKKLEEEMISPIKLDLRIRTIKPTIAAILLLGVFMINFMMIVFALDQPDMVNVGKFWPFSKDFMEKRIVIGYNKERIEFGFNPSIAKGYWGFNKVELFGKEEKIFILPFFEAKINIKVHQTHGIDFNQSKVYDKTDKDVHPKISDNWNSFKMVFSKLEIDEFPKKIGNISRIKINFEKTKGVIIKIRIQIVHGKKNKTLIVETNVTDNINLSEIKWNTEKEILTWSNLTTRFGNYSIEQLIINCGKNQIIYLKNIEIHYKNTNQNNASQVLVFGPSKKPFGRIIVTHPISYELAIFLLVLFSIIIFISSIFTLRRRKFALVITGCVLGILSIGFLVGAIFSIIALSMIIMSRDEF